MNINRKIKNKKGFTLVESVVTLLTATIVTALFLVLVNLAKNTYVEMQEASQGQILSANITNAIQDELRYASYVRTTDSADSNGESSFTYYSASLGQGDGCSIVSLDLNGSGKTKIYVKHGDDKYALIGNETYIFNLQGSVDCKYNKNKKQFHCIVTITDSKNNATIITSEFYVDPLNKGSL